MKFSEYIKDQSPGKVKNNFDDIVLQYIKKERQGKPLNWERSKPFISKDKTGKPTGNGFIRYISLEDFKEKLAQDLSNPMAKRKDVIEHYRKNHIGKAVHVNEVNNIYRKIKAGQLDAPYNSTLQSKYNYSYTKLSVIELIHFEQYLDGIGTEDAADSAILKTLPDNELKKIFNVSKLDSFNKLEQRLYNRNYIDGNRNWLKKAPELVALILVLIDTKYFKNFADDIHIRNFFQILYQFNITQQFKPSRRDAANKHKTEFISILNDL